MRSGQAGSEVRGGKDGMCRSRGGSPKEWLQELGMVSVHGEVVGWYNYASECSG